MLGSEKLLFAGDKDKWNWKCYIEECRWNEKNIHVYRGSPLTRDLGF